MLCAFLSADAAIARRAVDAGLNPLEKNGFTIIDFTEDRIEGQMFSWKMDEPEERLDNLKPFHSFIVARRM